MKIICSNKTVNLDKFENVGYRASLFGDGYPVEATRHEGTGGLFGGIGTVTEEIARFPHECTSQALVKAITDSWLANEQVFDVGKWKREKAPLYTPESEPIPQSKELQKMEDGILSIVAAQKNITKKLNRLTESEEDV